MKKIRVTLKVSEFDHDLLVKVFGVPDEVLREKFQHAVNEMLTGMHRSIENERNTSV